MYGLLLSPLEPSCLGAGPHLGQFHPSLAIVVIVVVPTVKAAPLRGRPEVEP